MISPEVIHLGGKVTVTGSCHLLCANGLAILVDCGLAQGHDSLLAMEQWPVAPADIDYLFLTHAHIDHIGRLPELILAGFTGEIICSQPTKALLVPMLEDALSFASFSEVERQRVLIAVDEQCWGFECDGQSFKLKNGVSFSLGRAGHILGSVFVHFKVEQAGQEDWSVLFSGDLGNYDTPILRDPDPPPHCDLLILESTYGNRNHEGRHERLEILGQTLVKALADNGKIFIPAFSLGRTQEILFELDRLFSDQQWLDRFPRLQKDGAGKAPVPVFIDSPLALKITEIYSKLSPFWDQESRDFLAKGDHPFDFHNLYGVQRFSDHQKILSYPGPAIIIAGSGMCTGGRILDHLSTGLANRRNDIFFVGYQAQGTPGRDIIKYSSVENGYVRLDQQKIPIRAAVHQLSGYSAHADQQGLLKWLEAMPEKPGRVRLVHGEPDVQKELAAKLGEMGYRVSG